MLQLPMLAFEHTTSQSQMPSPFCCIFPTKEPEMFHHQCVHFIRCYLSCQLAYRAAMKLLHPYLSLASLWLVPQLWFISVSANLLLFHQTVQTTLQAVSLFAPSMTTIYTHRMHSVDSHRKVPHKSAHYCTLSLCTMWLCTW